MQPVFITDCLRAALRTNDTAFGDFERLFGKHPDALPLVIAECANAGWVHDLAFVCGLSGKQLGQGKPGGGNGEGGKGNGQNPGGSAGGPGGKPDLRNFPADIAAHNGKAWGELPGELRTKIIQQMSARYGEDYARNIKLYFESVAERK